MRIPALISIAALLFATAACGKSKPADTTPAGGGDDDGFDDENSGGDMVPPERMDEIKAQLDRKRTGASRCLADAVNSGKLPRNTKGHVALGFTIGTNGTAKDLKVIETSIDSEDVQRCVMEKVQQIDFGALPAELEWSYTFAFESM
jgi:hypothetical protein